MLRQLAFATLFAVAAGPAMAAGIFGAIAYSPEFDNISGVADKASQQQAEDAAIKGCRDETKSNPDSCQSGLWFKSSCGALARDPGSPAWGTGWGDTQQIATKWALDICRQYGGKACKLKIAICSPGGASTIPKN